MVEGNAVAVLGAGTVGITLAARLAMQGYRVVFGVSDVEGLSAKRALASVPVGMERDSIG